MRDEQRLISDLIVQNDAKLIVSGMGSGKTAGTLDALRKLLDTYQAHHVLIAAPLLVAQETWPDEIETWRHTRAIRYAVAVGTPEERAAAIRQRAEITTINFENLQWLAQHIGTVNNWYWDTVVIDESSRLKAGLHRTKTVKYKDAEGRTKVRKGGSMTRFGILATARPKIRRIIELTGTPTPQGVIDLWGQMYLLDRGKRLGRTRTAFEKKWFDKNSYTYEVKPRDGAEAEITAAVSDLMVTIPPKKLVDDPIFIPTPVTLPKKAMADYLAFEETLYSEPYDVEAVSSGVLANKLLQFANGALYKEDRSVVPVHDAKLKALDEIVKQAGDENLLVFYNFKFDKEAIRKRYPDAVVANEDRDFVKNWNAGKIRMGLAHAASIGHGTNLQYGGRIAVWYGLTFNLELWQQANARLPRPGQKGQVLIYPLIARGTYDERAYAALQLKGATQDRIVASFLHQR